MKPLNKIPEGWKYYTLKDIGAFQYGYTTSAKKDNTGVKFVRITDIEENGKINWNIVPFCTINSNDFEKFKLDLGDILFARIGSTTGKTTLINQRDKAVFASYLIRFKVHQNVNSQFVYYFTQSKHYWNQAFKQREGQLKKGMNANTLSKIEISLPESKNEQRAIIQILSKIDQSIEVGERERQTAERIKRGIMVKLLSRGIGNKKFKYSKELDCDIPEHWDVVRYIDVAEFINGYPFAPSEWKKEGLPIIRIQNLNGNEWYNHFDGKIDKDYIVNKGDLLFSWSATIDLFIWQKEKAVLNQHIFKVVPKKGISKNYLFYAMKNYLSTISGKVHGSTMKHFKKEQLYKNYLPLPPLEEQERIVSILSTIDQKIDLEKKRKDKLERIKKGLMNDLLTGKKRVNVERVLEVEK